MTKGEMDIFLLGTMMLCAVMAVFNFIKNSKRGLSAYILSSAFLVMGGTVYMYRSDAPNLWVKIGCAVLVALLCADFLLRAGTPPPRKKKR